MFIYKQKLVHRVHNRQKAVSREGSVCSFTPLVEEHHTRLAGHVTLLEKGSGQRAGDNYLPIIYGTQRDLCAGLHVVFVKDDRSLGNCITIVLSRMHICKSIGTRLAGHVTLLEKGSGQRAGDNYLPIIYGTQAGLVCRISCCFVKDDRSLGNCITIVFSRMQRALERMW